MNAGPPTGGADPPPLDDRVIVDEVFNLHLATLCGTTKRIHFTYLTDHLGPASRWHIVRLIFNDGWQVIVIIYLEI
ncbi:MAG: hypothetical protein OEW18_04575 [Candidatus Aminicenantes bacterium]|nr:hypothetical protein [Candidatus Aminicenantes bacterium]